MDYFDNKFYKREKRIRRNYEIDDSLYTRLEEYSTIYEASVADLINACIENLINNDNGDITVYEKDEREISVLHTILIRESNIKGLDTLKDKYGLSIYKLVNIAIKSTLEE